MSNSQQMKKGLSVRDLITTGILAALYMVCAMIGEAIFGFFPVLTFLCPLSIALLCGPVYMLILAKVPKHCHRYFGRRCTVRTRYVLVYVFGILYSRRCGRSAGRFREL